MRWWMRCRNTASAISICRRRLSGCGMRSSLPAGRDEARQGRRMTESSIGRSLRRLEDERFLTGVGRYVDDIDAPGQLHGFVLRSPHGHAAIESIDTAAVREMPG